MGDTYRQLIAFLDEHAVQYRLIDHPMVLKTGDYTALAKPRLERIADVRGARPGPVAGS
jgi:hypothetical protein